MRFLLALVMCLISTYAYPEPLNYNTDVFDLGKNPKGIQNKNYKCHTAHINYKNMQGDFQKIDTTLTQDTDMKWKQSKASYHCSIPEYADDWFEFYNAYEGANHTIKVKPICQHINGEVFQAEDGDGILYKDAFGKDMDLKVYAYWGGLKKVIIINEKPVDTSKDITFDFELDLPATKDDSQIGSVASIKVKDTIGNLWDKVGTLDFKDKTIKIGEVDKESYFRQARIWDSKELNQSVDIELYVNSGKTYLRKTVKAEILEKAFYPLYTDHPTNYYVGAGDGQVSLTSGSGTWNTIHAAENGDTVSSTGTTVTVLTKADDVTPDNTISRTFFPIDTSGIADGDTISSAILQLCFVLTSNGTNDGDDWINVIQTSQADPTTLGVGDYDQCGAVTDPTEGATRIDITNIPIGRSIDDVSDNGSGKARFQTTAAHGYSVGMVISMALMGETTYNSVQTITNVSDTTHFDTSLDYIANADEAGTVLPYIAFTLDATGIGWIDKVNANGTLLGIREGHDAINSPPDNVTTSNRVRFSTSEDTSGTKDPYLDVTTEGAPPAIPPNIIWMNS